MGAAELTIGNLWCPQPRSVRARQARAMRPRPRALARGLGFGSTGVVLDILEGQRDQNSKGRKLTKKRMRRGGQTHFGNLLPRTDSCDRVEASPAVSWQTCRGFEFATRRVSAHPPAIQPASLCTCAERDRSAEGRTDKLYTNHLTWWRSAVEGSPLFWRTACRE